MAVVRPAVWGRGPRPIRGVEVSLFTPTTGLRLFFGTVSPGPHRLQRSRCFHSLRRARPVALWGKNMRIAAASTFCVRSIDLHPDSWFAIACTHIDQHAHQDTSARLFLVVPSVRTVRDLPARAPSTRGYAFFGACVRARIAVRTAAVQSALGFVVRPDFSFGVNIATRTAGARRPQQQRHRNCPAFLFAAVPRPLVCAFQHADYHHCAGHLALPRALSLSLHGGTYGHKRRRRPVCIRIIAGWWWWRWWRWYGGGAAAAAAAG